MSKLYDYKCDSCGCEFSSEDTNAPVCADCGSSDTFRDYGHQSIRGHYAHPIVSNAMGMNPDQIPEHKRLFPNIDVTDEGQPVFDNFGDHEKYLKATGFRKQTQKTRVKGTTVA